MPTDLKSCKPVLGRGNQVYKKGGKYQLVDKRFQWDSPAQMLRNLATQYILPSDNINHLNPPIKP